jgi:hypothetical protein
MPGPKPPEVVLSDAERRELERLVCAHKTGQALVRRARVVHLAAMGYSNVDIAGLVPMDEEAVGLWRRRWVVWRGTPLAEVSVATGWRMRRGLARCRASARRRCARSLPWLVSSRAARVDQSATGVTASWPTRSCVEASPIATRHAMPRGC